MSAKTVWALRDDYCLETGAKLYWKKEDVITAFKEALDKVLPVYGEDKNSYIDGEDRTYAECIEQLSFYDGDAYYLTAKELPIHGEMPDIYLEGYKKAKKDSKEALDGFAVAMKMQNNQVAIDLVNTIKEII